MDTKLAHTEIFLSNLINNFKLSKTTMKSQPEIWIGCPDQSSSITDNPTDIGTHRQCKLIFPDFLNDTLLTNAIN